MEYSERKQANQISEADKELVASIIEDFKRKNYVFCLQSLNKLDAANNLKIAHNRAVAEYYKSDLRRTDQFKKSLIALTQLSGDFNHVDIKNSNLCPIYYNQAVVLFHLKQPYSALKIMKAIMNHTDHLENGLVEKAGLLTATLLLDTNQAKKADLLLQMLQNRLDLNNDDILSPDEFNLESEERKKELDMLDEEQEIFRKLFRLVLIRSNLLNRKNILIPGEETSDFSILKGHQYYLGNDYQMAAKELSKQFKNELITVKKYGEEQNVCLANNMGLIHFAVKHYALAVKYFQQALLFDQKAMEIVKKEYGNLLPLHCLGATKRPEILYNLGIALLYLQRPKDAFDCLLVPLNIYHKNPRLWLRLAEACIMVHKQNLKEQEKQSKNIVSSVIGSGRHRKYLITPSPHKYVTDEQSSAIPSPNLEFASLCLRNALTLITYYSTLANSPNNENKAGTAKDKNESFSLFGNNWNKIQDGIPCNPSRPLTKAGIEKLKMAILTAYSYVSICLGEYTMALKYGKELIQIPTIPDTHRMLGHLYCAEALIMLDRVKDAMVYLEPKFINELKPDDFATADWNVNSLDAAQSILAYNLAVALAISGEYELAKSPMSICKHPIVFNKLKMLEIYLEMQCGNIENCKKLIKTDTPQFAY